MPKLLTTTAKTAAMIGYYSYVLIFGINNGKQPKLKLIPKQKLLCCMWMCEYCDTKFTVDGIVHLNCIVAVEVVTLVS